MTADHQNKRGALLHRLHTHESGPALHSAPPVPTCCSLNLLSILPPQGFCTCYFPCLEYPSPDICMAYSLASFKSLHECHLPSEASLATLSKRASATTTLLVLLFSTRYIAYLFQPFVYVSPLKADTVFIHCYIPRTWYRAWHRVGAQKKYWFNE